MEDLERNRFPSETMSISEFLKDQEPIQKENRNFSRDKMKLNLNLKDRKINYDLPIQNNNESLLNEINSSEVNVNCADHPDEEAQFYSFTNDKTLCSECVLSGLYTGYEVHSLKKAADRIKPKFIELLQEIAGKVEQLKTLQGKIEDKTVAFNDPVEKSKAVIKEQFNRIRAAVDKKEREILDKFGKGYSDKPIDPENQQEMLKEIQEKVLDIQETLTTKFKSLKDLDLCQYYASKAKLVRSFLNEEYAKRIRDLTQPMNSASFRNQFNASDYTEGINKLIEAVNNLKDNESRDLRSEFQHFQKKISRDFDQEKPEKLIENPAAAPLLKLMSNISEEQSEFPVRPRSVSPFKALRKELEIISPMPVLVKEPSSPGTATEENLRRLLERVEDMKKISQPNKEMTINDKRRDLKGQSISRLTIGNVQTQSMARLSLFDNHHTQSNSKLLQVENIKEKDNTSKKFWETYKGLAEEQSNNKHMLVASTTKLGDPERNKPAPRSYITNITELSKPKAGIGADVFSPPARKELYSSSSSQGLTSGLESMKNLRSLIQDDTAKQVAWKQNKRNEERYSAGSNFGSKSFGTSSLSVNLRKLKKEMGLLDE